MKNCKVKLIGDWSYSLTIDNLKMMIQHGIQISEVGSYALRTEGQNDTLLKFVEVIREIKHLKEFQFECEAFEDANAPPMESLADLPFKHLKSYQFKIFGKEDVVRMAKTL